MTVPTYWHRLEGWPEGPANLSLGPSRVVPAAYWSRKQRSPYSLASLSMVPVIILAISLISLVRFLVSYFRATLTQAGTLTVSDEVRVAARLTRAEISGEDFAALRGVHSLTPGGSGSVGFVSLYYHVVKSLGKLAGSHASFTAWTKQEMTKCAYYVGVQIDQRLRLSLAQQAG